MKTFLKTDLETPKLDRLHSYLWLAGLPRPARPLHRQRALLRTICITESPDEHLLWHDDQLYIKPLPDYLFNYEFWVQNLCASQELHQSACGLLLSYAWLVNYKSDLKIAIEFGLLPKMEWNDWTAFMRDICDYIDLRTLRQVSPRYRFGELRLSRLNHLYHFGLAGISLHNLIYGYMSPSTRFSRFFEHNFRWILAVFVYISVVLSAIQVALATEKFSSSIGFTRFSYGFALFSIGVVSAAIMVMICVWTILFWFHLLSTIIYCNKVAAQRRN